MHFILKEPTIHRAIQEAERRIESMEPTAVPGLFSAIPLEAFAVLLHDLPEEFPRLRRYFPAMASEAVQRRWTGSSGYSLLAQSSGFVGRMVAMYEAVSAKPLVESQVLDYGVGWGRLLRLMLKYTPETALYGLDAWDSSLEIAHELRLRARLSKVDAYPTALPFAARFDLVFAFSVLTHLSQRSLVAVLGAVRRAISADGLFVVTIRPPEYWRMVNDPTADELIHLHQVSGFAYKPHNTQSIDGDIPYGDTSMSVAFLESIVAGWRVSGIEFGLNDPYQIIVGLRPV